MIDTLNAKFINTWVIIEDIRPRLGAEHPELADLLILQHEYPLDFVFLSPEGKLVTRLTSFKDMPGAHPAVGHPRRDRKEAHVEIFLQTITAHFGEG